MSKNTQLANNTVNIQANDLAALLNSGFCDIFDGTQPATADTAITTQNKLASVGFNATAFGNASAGVITANPMTACTAADATGTAAWARCYKTDHNTVVMDVSVGTANTNIVLNAANIQANAQVSISSFVHTVQKSTSGY